ncbi:hypothetical protein [Geothrix fuzhouensis]|uniref:hypothetical protein n=1 Tax=Geothrix fuzhouensis TaxID=2966451 RepID=UPI0021490B05|nr:hypothetical protein [Geothrix fuzhouensis]
MENRTFSACPIPRPGRRAGFVRHDLFLLATLVFLALAVVLPRLLHGQWKGAMLGLLILGGTVLAGILLLLAVDWLQQPSDRPVQGWSERLACAIGHLLRFALFGSIGAIIASALAANHRVGAHGENLAAAVTGVLAGLLGTALYLHLGKTRFWPGFRRFALASLGAFFGGIIGILGPDPWGVDAGILLPLVVFLVLALLGRIAPAPPVEIPDSRRGP